MPEHKTKPFGGSTCLTRSFLLISLVVAVPAVALYFANLGEAAPAVAPYSASLLAAEQVVARCSASLPAAELVECTKPGIRGARN